MEPETLRGEGAHSLLAGWCGGAGIETPTIPDHLIAGLRSSEGPFVTTDGTRWDAYGGYGLEFGFGVGGHLEPDLGDYLSAAMPDYFIAGGKGNGYNTMWGFAIRSGGLFASVQLTTWNWNESDKGSPTQAQRAMQSFNRILAPFLGEPDRPLNTCVLYSPLRNYAGVLTTYRPAWLDAQPSEVPLLAPPPGWGYATKLFRRDTFTVTPVADDDAPEELLAGIRFLDDMFNHAGPRSDQ
jgi:hypothetical protein